MAIVRFRRANAMTAAGGGVTPLVEWEESSEKKSLNLDTAFRGATAKTGLDGETITVDDEKWPALTAALDNHPGVTRAGGATPYSGDPVKSD